MSALLKLLDCGFTLLKKVVILRLLLGIVCTRDFVIGEAGSLSELIGRLLGSLLVSESISIDPTSTAVVMLCVCVCVCVCVGGCGGVLCVVCVHTVITRLLPVCGVSSTQYNYTKHKSIT